MLYAFAGCGGIFVRVLLHPLYALPRVCLIGGLGAHGQPAPLLHWVHLPVYTLVIARPMAFECLNASPSSGEFFFVFVKDGKAALKRSQKLQKYIGSAPANGSSPSQ